MQGGLGSLMQTLALDKVKALPGMLKSSTDGIMKSLPWQQSHIASDGIYWHFWQKQLTAPAC